MVCLHRSMCVINRQCRLWQGFQFASLDSATPWGLTQKQGGPCGVLAATQCFLLTHLLFDPENLTPSKLNSLYHNSTTTAPQTPFSQPITDTQRWGALVAAIAGFIWRCTPYSKYTFVTARVSSDSLIGDPDVSTPLTHTHTMSVHIHTQAQSVRIHIYTHDTRKC